MNEVPAALVELQTLGTLSPDNAAIRDWKKSGKKIIAFECTYVPEEIIYAAGALPVRLVGDSGISNYDEANAYMYQNTCSFIRNCLELVLKGRYNFLDGFAAGATCDCSRRLADVWEHYSFTPFIHTIGVPRKISPEAYELYEIELRRFMERLSEYLNVTITADALQDAIALYNQRRRLLRELYDLNKLDSPPLKGSELMDILNASVTVPPDQFNNLLERLLKDLKANPRRVKGRFRIMIGGSPLNNAAFIRAIEEQGGLVVIDELCTGVRYWWEGVDPDADPVKALSRRYLHNFACPRMEPSDDRLQRIVRLVKDYRVEAVIAQMVRYCVPQTMEQPLVRDLLKEIGLPVLELDIEYGMGGTGQITTRLQAFFEMLEGRTAR
ncbi:MAG: 2-hydroxyacyl-CoA dehydratase [Dehalococcoidales bacterium]|nr:2-hydroxyacyl-CoA dehydratase [Dehalococcoidales bacterium]